MDREAPSGPARAARVVTLIVAVGFATAVAGCGKEGGGEKAPPPERPATGAPAAVVVDKIAKDGLEVRVYNFSDRTIAEWVFLMRYRDASGAVLKIKPGTPFEKDFDFWSLSGRKFAAEPGAWTPLVIEGVEVPEGAASAEVLVQSATALKEGGGIEGQPLWKMERIEWPAGAP